jgi:hypothetical protein
VPSDRYISPSDRDYLVRTVLGEANGQPDDGLAAVAHVVMNRVNSGKYGSSPTEVVFAPNQFEPWSTRRKELLGIDDKSPAYQKAAAIVDGVLSGKIKDPTSGATHFLQEDIVRQRRGGTLPDWATGKNLKIGAHTFYYPDETPVKTASVVDKYSKFDTGNATPPLESAPLPAEVRSVLDRYTKQAEPPASENLSPPPVPPEFPFTGPLPEPYKPPTGLAGAWDEFKQRTIGGIGREAPRIGNALISAPKDFVKRGVEETTEGVNRLVEGVKQIAKGEILPRGFGEEPSKRDPGGALRVIVGGLQAVGGATGITPATEKVEQVVTAVTGNPEAGNRAGILANMTVGPRTIGAGVNKLRAQPRAVAKVGETELTAEQLQRMRDNPNLSPMDVNPSLRGQGMGLYLEPGASKNKLDAFVRDRTANAPERVVQVYRDTVGPAPNIIDTVEGFKKTARDNAAKGFGEAFKDAKPVNVQDLVDKIDKKLKPGATSVMSPSNTLHYGPLEQRLLELRNDLTNGTALLTDPQRLHEIQSALGREIRNLRQSTTGSDRNLGSRLKEYQDGLVGAIDDAAGGKYRPAREKYKSDMDVQEAVEKGAQILVNRPNYRGMLEDTPDAWRRWIKQASPEELEAARIGGRAIIEHSIQSNRWAARKGVNIEEIPYNREKLRDLYGEKEAARLERLIRDEMDIATTNNKLIANSATAERMANKDAVKVRDLNSPVHPIASLGIPAEIAGSALGAPGVGTIAMTAAMSARHVANRLGRRSDIARNEILTDLLTRTGAAGAEVINQAAAQKTGNRLLNLATPTLPFTYVPPEVRESRPVPLKKDR